jgi:hypothetical protein
MSKPEDATRKVGNGTSSRKRARGPMHILWRVVASTSKRRALLAFIGSSILAGIIFVVPSHWFASLVVVLTILALILLWMILSSARDAFQKRNPGDHLLLFSRMFPRDLYNSIAEAVADMKEEYEDAEQFASNCVRDHLEVSPFDLGKYCNMGSSAGGRRVATNVPATGKKVGGDKYPNARWCLWSILSPSERSARVTMTKHRSKNTDVGRLKPENNGGQDYHLFQMRQIPT